MQSKEQQEQRTDGPAPKKVLVITYYWPPSGGAGVQRMLKTVKYLRDFGWEPIVFTAQDAAYPVLDTSLLHDVPTGQKVLYGPIWEPYELYKRFTGQNKKERVYSGFMDAGAKPSLTQRLSVWLRGNLFIPDARALWIRPSVRLLNRWLRDNPVDAILSSGPPHSVHLIARNLKRRHGIPWLADFRDPWTNIDFYDQLMLTGWADRRHKRLEQSVLREADAVDTVSWSWAEDFQRLGRADVAVITNGFDTADFPPTDAVAPDPAFAICHVGSLNKDRNSPALWESLAELAREDDDFRRDLRLRFIGKTEEATFAQLNALDLTDNVERVEYVPHAEVVAALGKARVLLLLTNDTPNVMGVVPGKLFEYLAAGRPILAIGAPEGDSARILRETGAGTLCGFQDRAAMKEALRTLYRAYRAGEPLQAGDPTAIQGFTRRGGAGKIAALLGRIANA